MLDTTLCRNVALLGNSGTGKTSVAEALLYTAGKTTRLGKVDDGSSVLDFEPEEIRKRSTISSSFHQYDWKKHGVFLIDTPGDDNFLTESLIATRVADAAILVLDASTGIKYQAEKIAAAMRANKLPGIIFVNKMEKERADYRNVVEEAKNLLKLRPAVVQIPIGTEQNFRGVVDVINQKAYFFDEAGAGRAKEGEIPADMVDEVRSERESLMEAIAETDDALVEKFLEEGELSIEEMRHGLKNGAKSGALYPVLLGAATKNLGVELLLNAINDLLPSPADKPAQIGTVPGKSETVERKPLPDEPFSALVFKTMTDPYAGKLNIFRVLSGTLKADSSFLNATKGAQERFGQLLVMEGKAQRAVDAVGPGAIVAVAKLKETGTGDTLCADNAPILYEGLTPAPAVMSYAVSPAKKGDEEKVFSAIAKIIEEDITLKLTRETQTREIIISGVGQMHLEVVAEKIKRKYGVEMELRAPKVPYKETIKGKARVQGRYKKQSGGRGQFGDTWLEIEPLPSGSGFVFEDKIVGGVVPRQYIPAVEKGIAEALLEGAVAGYPVVDFKVALVDGSYHAVDSSEMAFKIAGSMGFKKGVLEANPILLEPIMNVTIRVPKDFVGDIIGDLNSRRGKVLGMDSEEGNEVVSALVPMSEIQRYAPDLTSMTGGRGSFAISYSHYEELPAHLAEKIIAAHNASKA